MDVLKIVENIQKICKDRGTNPTLAGKESGAGKDLVSSMKRRGVLPSIEKMMLLADYLGVTTSELLGEAELTGQDEKGEPTTVTGDGQAEKLAKALADIGIAVDKLSDAELSRIARLAKVALEE